MYFYIDNPCLLHTCHFSFLFCFIFIVFCKWSLINSLGNLNDLYTICSTLFQTHFMAKPKFPWWWARTIVTDAHHYLTMLIGELYKSYHLLMTGLTVCYLNTHRHTETLFGFTFLYWTTQDNKKHINIRHNLMCNISCRYVEVHKCVCYFLYWRDEWEIVLSSLAPKGLWSCYQYIKPSSVNIVCFKLFYVVFLLYAELIFLTEMVSVFTSR